MAAVPPSSVWRSAHLLDGEKEARITAILGDRIARAFLASEDARGMALDYNARLVTELRVAEIWPARYADRCAG
jgi:hypothetical protein